MATGSSRRTRCVSACGPRPSRSATTRSPSVLIAVDLIGVPRAVTEEVARRLAEAPCGASSSSSAPRTRTRGPRSRASCPTSSTCRRPRRSSRSSTATRRRSSASSNASRARRSPTAGRRASRGRRDAPASPRTAACSRTANGPASASRPAALSITTCRCSPFTATDGALRAVFVNYACHATTLEGRDNFVHGDWPGVAKELIQQRHPGAVALVTIGTGADSNPNPRGGGLPDVERNAAAIADEVDRLLAATDAAVDFASERPSRDDRPAARPAADAPAMGGTGAAGKGRRDSRRRRFSRGSTAVNASPPLLPIRSRPGRSATASAWSSLPAKSSPITGCG